MPALTSHRYQPLKSSFERIDDANAHCCPDCGAHAFEPADMLATELCCSSCGARYEFDVLMSTDLDFEMEH